ncbi:acyl-CoA dehydrogenase family protein [Enhygromyxa salina]|uniref:Acryloyl-CoA reductase NADH n=1 Tax=Enhygromyxa salina TaxID=215803 RepID=A0A2S9YN27_9BACT|nr:acyl-CoA dehydrogenase family protein [Enhygromyxa salina]PRQ06485.1 Acryloyl-CoA reductase NADH [Enhygromyxa salina]
MTVSVRSQLQADARRFAAARCNSGLEQLDREQAFNRAGWTAAAEHGLLGMRVPVALGGTARPLGEQLEILLGFGEGCEDNGLILALGAHVWACQSALLDYASDDLKAAVLPGLARGHVIASHAVSEPGAGSDVSNMATRARTTASGYVLDGDKTWVTNAPIAGLHVVFASTDPSAGSRGLSAFVVPAASSGVRVTTIEKMGLCTAQMGSIELREVEVPSRNRLGEEGQGFTILQHCMAWERAFLLAPMLGSMTRVMRRCVEQARRRRQFGQAIGEFDSVSNLIVEMRMRVELGRALLDKVAAQAATGRAFHELASMLKLHISEAWQQTCVDAVQLHGARGFTRELGLERELRDAVGGRIFSGTSEIQRRIIAQLMGVRR